MDKNPQLILPIEAQNRFAKVADEKHRLQTLNDAQHMIIDDVFGNASEEKAIMEKRIKAVDEELVSTDLLLQKAQYALEDILLNNQNNKIKEGPSEVLKIILPNFQNLIGELCKNTVDEGQVNVSLFLIYELEQKVLRVIDSLKERGAFPESDEATTKSFEQMQIHQKKVHDFLNEVLSEAKKSEPT